MMAGADVQMTKSHAVLRITTHPLYPLLRRAALACALCVQHTPNAVLALDSQLVEGIRVCEEQAVKLLGPDKEINDLMLDAIHVYRRHLMEIERVFALCGKFCDQYLQSLHARLQPEMLLPKMPTPADHGDSSGDNESDNSDGDEHDHEDDEGHGDKKAKRRRGSAAVGTHTHTHTAPTLPPPLASVSPVEDKDKKKRTHLPAPAIAVLKAWLFSHVGYPYPSEEEKTQLSSETGLTVLQVNNWFINARRRILQPLLMQMNQGGLEGPPGAMPGFKPPPQ